MTGSRSFTCLIAGSILIALVAGNKPAFAQASKATEAQTLFDDALVLMKAGKYAEACPKLGRSQQLDPGLGTQFRLAQCYEGLGHIATAWKLYVEVAAESKKAGRADREEQARERVDELRPRLPTLVITVPPSVSTTPGIEIKRDEDRVEKLDWNQKLPVDPGQHVVSVSAPGKKRFQQIVSLVEKATIDVQVPVLEPEGAPPATTVGPSSTAVATAAPTVAVVPTSDKKDAASSGLGGQKIAAIVVGSLGIVGLGFGAATGILATSQWNDALSYCQGGDRKRCQPDGVKLGSQASTSAAVSTVGFVAGGVFLAGATVLWLVAPNKPEKAAVRVSPMIGQEGGGAFVSGSF